MGFYVAYKVGDKGYKPGQPDTSNKKHLKVKDGMPVCYIDEDEWGLPIDEIVSDDCKRIFAIVEHSPSLKDTFKDIICGYGDDKEPTHKPRKAWVSFEEVATAVNQPDIPAKLRGPDKFEIFDAKGMPNSLLKDAANYDGGVHPDYNAITSGSATVGSGGTYATWALAYADLATLTGTLTFTQISDTTETASALMTEWLNGNDFVCTSDTPHYGDPSVGWVTSFGANANMFDWKQEGTGTSTLEHVQVKMTAAFIRAGLQVVAVGTAFTGTVRYNIFDGNGTTNFAGIYLEDNTPRFDIYGNVVTGFTTSNRFGMRFYAANTGNVIENNWVHGNGTNLWTNNIDAGTFRNNWFGGGVTADATQIGSCDGYNNADTDGTVANGNWSTGSGNQTSLTAADEYESLVIAGGSNMALPKTGSTVKGNGTAPTISGFTTYLNQVAIASPYDIGAKGFASAAAIVPQAMNSYRHRRV